MNILLLLIPLSLVLLVVMIAAFVWAVRNGQFDDLDTPPLDVLADKQPEAPPAQPPQDPR
ncbi:MAG: cbb3-type cytochrome oxidase assembly protein CcoS [Steroidobacteraceae bacterium]